MRRARLAREVPGIDVVFLGHTHQELADTTINGVLFTQAGNWAQSLAQRADARAARAQRLAGRPKQAQLFKPDAARR